MKAAGIVKWSDGFFGACCDLCVTRELDGRRVDPGDRKAAIDTFLQQVPLSCVLVCHSRLCVVTLWFWEVLGCGRIAGLCTGVVIRSRLVRLQALEFGRKVDLLCRSNERDLMALEARRKRNVVAATALRDDLLRSFGELETVVHAGRTEILAEQERQQVWPSPRFLLWVAPFVYRAVVTTQCGGVHFRGNQ